MISQTNNQNFTKELVVKKPLPIGISDFKKIREEGYAYVDKSLFIEELVEKGSLVSLIPRLRRFGKTLNLSMLRYFFEKTDQDHSQLFTSLKIWEKEKYRLLQGQFPVIFLTLKDIKHATWEETLESFQGIIAKEFGRHEYLLDGKIISQAEKDDYLKLLNKKGSKTLYENSLQFIMELLHRYHGK